MKVCFIGDVHGKYRQYKDILKEYPCTVQVGDMGGGFYRWPNGDPYPNPPYDYMTAEGTNHRFIRGNHDNPGWCRTHSQWISDGFIETTDLFNKIMYVGGAWSIDRPFRVENFFLVV